MYISIIKINGTSWISGQLLLPASMRSRGAQGKQGWASSWTDPVSPRPPWLVYFSGW